MRHPNVTLAALAALDAGLCAQGPMPPAVQEVVESRCLGCHDADAKKGGFDFEGLLAQGGIARLDALRRARERALAHEMPPRSEEPMPDAQRRLLAGWCAEELQRLAPQIREELPPVTMRRLSRFEWESTVFDLFGVRTPLVQDFPAEDLGYGFDNIGDAASFSTLHIEAFLAAAQDVAAQVFHGEDPQNPPRQQVEGEAMRLAAGSAFSSDGDAAGLYVNATIAAFVTAPRAGTYRLVVRCGGDQAGSEPPRMQVEVGAVDLGATEVPERQPREFGFDLALPAGRHEVRIAFVNDFWDPKAEDPTRRDRNLSVDWAALVGPLDPRPTPEQQGWIEPRAPLPTIVRALAERTARRTPPKAYVDDLLRLAQQTERNGGSRDEALRAALAAALASPRFLFRVEPQAAGVPSRRSVGEALAVRLSYLLWSSAPDDELLRLGRAGQLADPAVRRQQARRLLADPRAERLATNFAAQWLELRALASRTPDPELAPGADGALFASMRRETELLFLACLQQDLDVRTLLSAPFTHVDAALARHYGVDAAAADGFVRIDWPPGHEHRHGLLGHASVLALTSNPDRTSPVKRGKWILDNLLDQAPPPPPPGNNSFRDEQAARTPTSLREQLAQHREQAACAVCHERMDAFGLALERFDLVGRRRDQDARGGIDDLATLPSGQALAGAAGLREALAQDPAFVRTLLRKLFVYGMGRELMPGERLQLDLQAEQALAAGDVTIAALIELLVSAPAFGAIGNAR